MRNYNIPKIGMRNIKTAFSVFICIALFNLFKRDNAFYACIAAVICMKDTYENSLSIGINRLLGTFLGGLLGIITIPRPITPLLVQGCNPLTAVCAAEWISSCVAL